MVLGAILGTTVTAAAAAPTPAKALELEPMQKGVLYDKPAAADIANCTILAEKSQRRSAWVVRDGSGQILREFADTNGDNNVDQWKYYFGGIEVYREMDANFNTKADQYRWLATGGTRWGVDANEDGTIDSWRMISAEEVAEEVVLAIRENDAHRFQSLLLTDTELAALGVGSEHQAKIEERLTQAAEGFRSLVAEMGQRRLQIEFVDFGGAKPSLVPEGMGGATHDVLVYENAAALASFDGKHEQITLGTLAKVGDAWRIIAAPSLAADQQVGPSGVFFVPQIDGRPDPQQIAQLASNGPSEEEQKLLASLEELDRKVAASGADQRAQINEERIRVVQQLAEKAGSEGQQILWLRQLADMISAEVQAGFLPDGIERLEELKSLLEKKNLDKDLIAHVEFLAMTAAYSQGLQDPKADYVKIQEQWLKDLEAFVTRYPTSRETADALMQLGMAQEFGGDTETAETWYTQITADFRDSEAAKKAEGALRRLQSVGKPLGLQGSAIGGGIVDLASLKGKVVLVQYWATWCEPCLVDVARLREIYRQYNGQGFEIVGINVDTDTQQLAAYLKENPLPWRTIQEEGGLESRPAIELGVMTLPQMLLLDRDGKVVNRNVHVAELTSELSRLLK
jgi:thiol-disulfide isomerase/thioredoxin